MGWKGRGERRTVEDRTCQGHWLNLLMTCGLVSEPAPCELARLKLADQIVFVAYTLVEEDPGNPDL